MARTREQGKVSDARQQTTGALMDAAERLLYEVGYAGVTTRAVAEAAGVNHGLVHYYFGSMEELLTQTLERFVEQLALALEALYAEPTLTFAEKWRLGSQILGGRADLALPEDPPRAPGDGLEHAGSPDTSDRGARPLPSHL